jgi:MFS family permease
MSTNAVAILVDAFPERERGKALGVNMMVVYAGLTAGPLLGGILIQSLGWRSVFALNVPLGALIIILSLKWLKPSSVGVSQSFDLFGAISFSACLVPFLVSLTLGGTLGWTSIQVIVLMAVAAVFLGLFLWIEALSSQYPMLDLSLFMNNRLFTAANFTALAYYVSSTTTSFMISYYLQTILGLPPSQVGSILLVMPLMMALISPLSGWLSDRFGSFLMSALGMAIMTLALISFSSLETNAPTQDVLARLFVAGVGTGIFSSPNSSAVMGSVPREKLGVASGTLGTMRFIGQAISMTLAGAMLGSSMKLTEMFVEAMHAVFILSAVVAGTGFLISIMRGNRR